MQVIGTLRQLRYPREFRIAPFQPHEEPRPSVEPASEPRTDDEPATPDVKLLASVATGLWRMRQRMIETDTGEPRPEMRSAYRHLESTWDALVASGVEIQDHAGIAFDSGLSLRVIAFQPTAGLEVESVIETIRPSVYVDGQPIQVGEVIVGTPETEQHPDGQSGPRERPLLEQDTVEP